VPTHRLFYSGNYAEWHRDSAGEVMTWCSSYNNLLLFQHTMKTSGGHDTLLSSPPSGQSDSVVAGTGLNI